MNDLLQILAGSATVGAVIVFLGRLIINKGFDAALESFKNKLQLLKIEHQIRYSKLHEERAELLKTMYSELYSLEKSLVSFTSLFQGPEWTEDNTRYDEARNKLIECRELLEKNRIFFTKSFCSTLADALEKSKTVLFDMESARIRGRAENQAAKSGGTIQYKEGQTSLDLWRKQEEAARIDIVNQRIDLAETFREIIGVEEEKN